MLCLIWLRWFRGEIAADSLDLAQNAVFYPLVNGAEDRLALCPHALHQEKTARLCKLLQLARLRGIDRKGLLAQDVLAAEQALADIS